MPAVPYREFAYPLNVLMHVLMVEEGGVDALHYGIFASASESIADAQARATLLLLERLPPPPARVLDVGIGVGTTLARLTTLGYQAEGITPDASQLALVRERYGERVAARCAGFEQLSPSDGRWDVLLFQESSQYIAIAQLFAVASSIAPRVLVMDELALRDVEPPSTIHSRGAFLKAAVEAGFKLTEEIDLSEAAAPTVDYFLSRLPRLGDELRRDVGLADHQLAELMASGERYRQRYADGAYAYRLMDFSWQP